jgi:Icc-related predicted phosphoesterase
MKCLLVSDLHYTLKQLDWLTAVAGHFDVVVVAGDHLDISSTVALEAQIVVILKYLQRTQARAPLLVSSGNHDLNATNGDGEKYAAWMSRVRRLGVSTDGDALETGEALFSICPWWDGPATRAAVDRQLERDSARRHASGLKWVWIYHSPPDASPTSWGGQRHYGDTDLVAWIARYRPDMVLTGHIHQSPFRQGGSWVDRIEDTWVFNAGRQIGPVPCHIVIDSNEQHARWYSLAGNQEVDLDRPLTRPLREIA